MNELSPEQLADQFRDAIRRELLKGIPIEQVRVHWNGLEWHFSTQTRRWELLQDHHPGRRGNEIEVPT